MQVSQVIVFGNVQITTPALRLLLDEGIEVVLLSETGRFYGRLVFVKRKGDHLINEKGTSLVNPSKL